MKYKPGDKVKIKTWEDMETEFGLDSYGNINCYNFVFSLEMEKNVINKNLLDRVFIIGKVNKNHNYYEIYESILRLYAFTDDMIEDSGDLDSIESRFDILDL